ncbi:MAG: hypothetical protein ACT4QE_25985, partial [Anaerolineales bacterium]
GVADSITGFDGGQGSAFFLRIVATLSGLVGILFLMAFVLVYPQITEVDSLLSGKTLIAHWYYAVDEQNQPKVVYVYIGHKGVYKDDVYFQLVGGSRQLLHVTYEEGLHPKLRFVYRVINWPNSRSSGGSSFHYSLVMPVPPDKYEEARRVVAEFSQRVAGTLA